MSDEGGGGGGDGGGEEGGERFTIGGGPIPNFGYMVPYPKVNTLPPVYTAPTSPPPPVPMQPLHLQFNPSLIGSPTLLSIGRARLPGQVIWLGDDTQAVPGDQATTGYRVPTTLSVSNTSFACAFCEPIDPTDTVYIQSMSAHGTVFYDLGQGGVVDVATLDTAEMQALRDSIGSMRLYQGGEGQLPDPTIEHNLGVGNAPAFRGLRYLVLKRFPMGLVGGGIPTISVEFRRYAGGTIPVSTVFEKLATKRGLALDASALDDTCLGYNSSGQKSLIDILRQHADVYNFQILDGNPIRLNRRAVGPDLVIDLEVLEADCVRKPMGASVNYTRHNPGALPIEVRVQYSDPTMGFDTNTQPARHGGDATAFRISNYAIEFVLTSSVARQLAFDTLYRLRTRSLEVSLEIKDCEPEAGDVIEISAVSGVGPELISNPRFTSNADGYTLYDSTWAPGAISTTLVSGATTGSFYTEVNLVSGVQYALTVHQTVTGDDTTFWFAHASAGWPNPAYIWDASTKTLTFTSDYTGLDFLSIDFNHETIGATRTVTGLSLRASPDPSIVRQSVVALIKDQTFTDKRTNLIQANALLKSSGADVAGADGVGNPPFYLWPEDCIQNNAFLVVDGQFWAATLFGGLFSVNQVPDPFPKLYANRAFVLTTEDDGITFISGAYCWADGGAYVYALTTAAQLLRFNKNKLTDWQILNVIELMPAAVSQMVVHDGKAYFVSEGELGGSGFAFRATRLWIVDLTDFTATGISNYEVVDHTLTPSFTVTPLEHATGLVIAGGKIWFACANTGNIYFSDLSSVNHFWDHIGPFPSNVLGYGVGDDSAAYFTPFNQLVGAKFNAATPNVPIYFSITDDPNVLGLGGIGHVQRPCFDDNGRLCFVVRDTADIRYIARWNPAGAMNYLPGISISSLVANPQDAETFNAFNSVLFDGGYYYLPGSTAFIKIRESDLVGVYYPRQSFIVPLNDSFYSPQIITAPFTVVASNFQATIDVGEPANYGPAFLPRNSHSIWYLFEPTVSGTYTFEMSDPTMNPKLGIFVGDDITTLSLMAVVLGPVALELYCIAGVRYRISCDGEGLGAFAGGQFTFTLSEVVIPVLDADEDFLMLIT